MNIGLYFGSFNPIHIGHLAIANYIVEFSDIEQLWFVVSPQNPFKKKSTLLDDYQRLELVNIAIDKDLRFKASNIEFNLPKPSYTINTLKYLEEKHPNFQFSLIMGVDNLTNLHKWKNFEQIIANYSIYVYPRPGIEITENFKENENIVILDAPIMDISSSFIREAIKKGKQINYYLPYKVYDYISEMHFYE